jgi:hypothetical protein
LGTKVFRYGWRGKYVYHIFIPISSCAYCEVYGQQGNKIQLANDTVVQDYIFNRKNEILVWECNIFRKEAILIWQGEYDVDGCGFFVEIENKRYKPQNESFIGDEFKTDTTFVLIGFIYLDREIEYWCGDLPFVSKKDGIKVFSIKKM